MAFSSPSNICWKDGLSITISCNGKSAVDQLNSAKPIKPTEAHYNILAAIQAIQQQIPITSIIQHMNGHEEHQGVTIALCREAWMNIKMEEVAKQAVVNTKATKGYNAIPGEPWESLIDRRNLVKIF